MNVTDPNDQQSIRPPSTQTTHPARKKKQQHRENFSLTSSAVLLQQGHGFELTDRPAVPGIAIDLPPAASGRDRLTDPDQLIHNRVPGRTPRKEQFPARQWRQQSKPPTGVQRRLSRWSPTSREAESPCPSCCTVAIRLPQLCRADPDALAATKPSRLLLSCDLFSFFGLRCPPVLFAGRSLHDGYVGPPVLLPVVFLGLRAACVVVPISSHVLLIT